MIKKYYKIEFKLVSPLSVGSGENEVSDSDVIRKANGVPFVPGTSLAGIYRSIFDKETGDLYFGSIIKGTEQSEESAVLTYDANVSSAFVKLNKRDGVGLDEFKTVKKGAKYDFEVVEPNTYFVTYLEQNITSKCPEDIGKKIVAIWKKLGLKIGAKTARGYGDTALVNVWAKTYDLSKKTDAEKWVEFDLFDDKSWTEQDLINDFGSLSLKKNTLVRMKITLEQTSGISVRKYSTRVSETDRTEPDFEQMAYFRGNEWIPFIPGTSWAGAFRHHMELFISKSELDTLFGVLGKRSGVSFSETQIEGATVKVITRNAIDRFAGGTSNGALYTERTYFGGNTNLVIDFPKNLLTGSVKSAIAATLADLHLGMMGVGGLTSIGRGLFRISDIMILDSETNEQRKYSVSTNNETEDANSIYTFVKDNI